MQDTHSLSLCWSGHLLLLCYLMALVEAYGDRHGGLLCARTGSECVAGKEEGIERAWRLDQSALTLVTNMFHVSICSLWTTGFSLHNHPS